MSKQLSRYVVVNARTCHGKPTFRGTRVLVEDVLEQVASGMSWESIIEEWRGSIGREAVADAIRLANKALIDLQKLVRAGWAGGATEKCGAFVVKARPMGLRAGIDPASLNKQADERAV